MTDWLQPLVVALTQTAGLSIVHETVYEKRLGFTRALNDMGATIQLYRECLGGLPCRIGQRNFQHSADGTSRVHGIDLIERGYEHFHDKLDAVGASYERG
jgi:UDP-N-acetylglucosamine 1-carboxyvinyltransferase